MYYHAPSTRFRSGTMGSSHNNPPGKDGRAPAESTRREGGTYRIVRPLEESVFQPTLDKRRESDGRSASTPQMRRKGTLSGETEATPPSPAALDTITVPVTPRPRRHDSSVDTPPSSRPGAPPTYSPGDVLADRYRLVRVLGEGGMGTVWEARSLGLDLDVAIKLLQRVGEIPDAAQRLQREAQAAARVVHPAAVRVLDFSFTSAGDPFLVMERLSGIPLSRWLRSSGGLNAVAAVRLVLPIVDALVKAHREGVIHRDIKPANILLDDSPMGLLPKLIDFGIARMFKRAEPKHFTRRGMLLGSPAYMAPEQILGDEESDVRVDIWGVCLLLLEILTGKNPFRAADPDDIVDAILDHDLSCPYELTDATLWEIIEQGLRKEKSHRWPSMFALGHALAEWAVERRVQSDILGVWLPGRWLNA